LKSMFPEIYLSDSPYQDYLGTEHQS